MLEIGAGAGQLRAWLPPALRGRIVHSEPSDAATRAVRARAADATVVRATAEALGLSYDQLRHALKRHGLISGASSESVA